MQAWICQKFFAKWPVSQNHKKFAYVFIRTHVIVVVILL